MKKRPICRAGCLAAAALLSCAPLLDMKGSVLQAAAAEETVSDTLVSVIVTVRGDALLATEEGASQGADYLETDEAADRTAALKAVQQRVQAQIRGFYPALEVGFSYSVLVNGFSCELPEALIPAVRQLPAVESVTPAENRSVPRMAQAAALGGFPAYYDATGCKGEEQVIAVIDTEFDVTNPMFSAIDDKEVALTKADIAEIADSVGFNLEIDPEQAYVSSKLPFVVDYVDDPYAGMPDSDSYHGTHVAGIAAGNPITDYNGSRISGVAPDAQIVFMAVGVAESGGMIDNAAAIAAAEDAVKLHADVINMSFGITGEQFYDDPLDAAYETARNAGVIICKAAGNDGDGTRNSDPNIPANPDYGTLDTFQAGAGLLSVASADNTYTQHSRTFRVGDELIPYTEFFRSETGMQPYYLADELTESEYEFVNLSDLLFFDGAEESDAEEDTLPGDMLPDKDGEEDGEAFGGEDDFDVSGKIAVFSMGSLEPEMLAEMASMMGAAGFIIIYYEGYTATGKLLDADIPFALISYEDGVRMLESGETTLTFTDDTLDIDLPTRLSPYSSWGVHASLELRPDITGIGGNVESAAYYGGQSLMSGTSMASPYVAGCTAILTEYLKKKELPLTGAEKTDFICSLLMNSAVPYETETDGMLVTPRQQGAGFVSLNNAIADKVLMTGREGNAKINLYDGIENSFTFPVTLTNISEEDVTFTGARLVLTTDGSTEDSNGIPIIQGQQPLTAEADLSALLHTDAGETRTEQITVRLDAAQTAEIAEVFCNGFFIDGFLLLSGAENCCDISIPLLGFRGDWSAVPILSEPPQIAVSGGAQPLMAGSSFMDVYGVIEDVLSRISEEELADPELTLLDQFWMNADEEAFRRIEEAQQQQPIRLSPNQDGLYDDLAVMLVPQRYAVVTGLDISDADGKLIAAGKTMPVSGRYMPIGIGNAAPLSSLGLTDGEYTASYRASINYAASKENPQTDSFRFTVDSTAPELTTAIREENGRRILTLTASDSALSGIFVSGTGKGGIAGSYDPDAEPGDPMRTFSLITIALSTIGGAVTGEPSEVQSDTLPLLAKYIGGYTVDADFADLGFTDLIPAEPDKSGSFTVEYDITDLTAYSFTAFDRVMNTVTFESEAAPAAAITPGVWKNQNRIVAFTETECAAAEFTDGTRTDGTYTAADGRAEFVFEQETRTAVLEQVNSLTLRLIWEDGTVEMLYYLGEGTLEDYPFYSAAEITETVLQHFADNYTDYFEYEMTRTETAMTGGDTVCVKFYCDINGEELLLSMYQVDIMTGEGVDLLGLPFTMNPITAEEALIPGIWTAVTEYSEDAGYYWFDGGNTGSYRALADGAAADFTYTVTEDGTLLVSENGEDFRQAQVIPIDDGCVLLIWEDETSEMLVYKSDESFDTFDFYTLSELTEMAMTDLEQKTGTRPESAETFIDETGTVVVQMNGADGEPADFYSVDPATGTGEDQEGGAVDLPQTGISDVQPMVWAMLAVLLTAAGVLAMAKSGVLRRRTR